MEWYHVIFLIVFLLWNLIGPWFFFNRKNYVTLLPQRLALIIIGGPITWLCYAIFFPLMKFSDWFIELFFNWLYKGK